VVLGPDFRHRQGKEKFAGKHAYFRPPTKPTSKAIPTCCAGSPASRRTGSVRLPSDSRRIAASHRTDAMDPTAEMHDRDQDAETVLAALRMTSRTTPGFDSMGT
jgi:hypothetical protein